MHQIITPWWGSGHFGTDRRLDMCSISSNVTWCIKFHLIGLNFDWKPSLAQMFSAYNQPCNTSINLDKEQDKVLQSPFRRRTHAHGCRAWSWRNGTCPCYYCQGKFCRSSLVYLFPLLRAGAVIFAKKTTLQGHSNTWRGTNTQAAYLGHED